MKVSKDWNVIEAWAMLIVFALWIIGGGFLLLLFVTNGIQYVIHNG